MTRGKAKMSDLTLKELADSLANTPINDLASGVLRAIGLWVASFLTICGLYMLGKGLLKKLRRQR
jgi:hypothetical protein